MSPVTGLAQYRDKFCFLFIWEISARSTGMKFKKQNQNGETFATVVALWTPVTLLIKLIRKLLKWRYIHCKNCAILAAMMRKRSNFVKKVSSLSPGLEYSYGKIFIPVTEMSVVKTEISVTGPARPLI